MLVGGGILYVQKTMPQTIFVKGHERKGCSIDSSTLQKTIFLAPFSSYIN
jgi:hypothetical protein